MKSTKRIFKNTLLFSVLIGSFAQAQNNVSAWDAINLKDEFEKLLVKAFGATKANAIIRKNVPVSRLNILRASYERYESLFSINKNGRSFEFVCMLYYPQKSTLTVGEAPKVWLQDCVIKENGRVLSNDERVALGFPVNKAGVKNKVTTLMQPGKVMLIDPSKSDAPKHQRDEADSGAH